jgi:cytochrome d ubiquinol oxidase subunit II
MINEQTLPIIFVGLMGLSVLVYAILDGYDLGVGILLPMNPEKENQRDIMIASIGPFWDANETWLVLAVGLMLIAFPAAHSLAFYHLYIPVFVMLIGLIVRGVSFDFRAKAAIDFKHTWDWLFKLGSILTTLAQGFMLGQFVMGFDNSLAAIAFCVLSALGVTVAYSYLGASWLIMKTEDALQRQSVKWALWCGRLTFLGVIAVSAINPLINSDVFSRWFTMPLVMFVLLIPTVCFIAFIWNEFLLRRLPKPQDRYCYGPFCLVVTIFTLCFIGLVFSFFPYIVPNQMTVWEAASDVESLKVIFYGAVVVIPIILIYTIFAYRVFHGKATSLRYH